MDKTQRLKKYWRVCTFGICFSMFGIGGLLMSYLWFPLARLFIREQEPLEAFCQRSVSFMFRWFTHLMCALGAIKVEHKSIKQLNNQQGCIIVANHPSLIDVILIIGQLPQCDCIVKAELWDNSFVRHVVSMAGYIPNSSEQLLDICQHKLAKGRKLLVFPEGTRTKPGQALDCQRGAAQLAVRCQAPIQTARINCIPATLYKGLPWYKVPDSIPVFSLEVDAPVRIDNFVSEAPSPSTAARRLTRFFNAVLDPNRNQQNITLEDYSCAKLATRD
ncbi:lysophospholipid acyltransferase family protein [Agarivorans sp. QJM3NY_33]|uniref:lysophospholipid acyltransferase family protein n=1 Tax=Agarivorans sp. QJM3NY_33 TaxID=3421432 RepID=UPI003D7EBB22